MSEQIDTQSNITPYSPVFLHTRPNDDMSVQYGRAPQSSKQSDPSSLVHLALLSRIATEMFRRISLSTMTKDNIEYHNAFRGSHAIVSDKKRRHIVIMMVP